MPETVAPYYSHPGYANAGVALGQAIFGAPQSTEDALNNNLTAMKIRKMSNEVYGQDQYRNILEGMGSAEDLNAWQQENAGSLAAAMGLAGINRNMATLMSLDPRMGEMEQRRNAVAGGDAISMGEIGADIAATEALTASRNRSNTGAGGKGGKGFKPPQLVPTNVEKIRNAAIKDLGIDAVALDNTLKGDSQLGTALLDAISTGWSESQGDAAAAQNSTMKFLSDNIDFSNVKGEWNPFDTNRYERKAGPAPATADAEVPQGQATPTATPKAPKIIQTTVKNGVTYGKTADGKWLQLD